MAETEERLARIETMVLDIHTMLSEIMPAAKTAAKMLNARSALANRWRGGKNAQ